MNRKVIFLDCDGTILDVPRRMSEVSDKTLYAIEELIKNGHLVFIASGRARCMLPQYLYDIKGINYVTTNGAYSYLNDGTEIGCHVFDPEIVKEVNDYCVKNGHVCFNEAQDFVDVSNMDSKIYKDFMDDWEMSTKQFKPYEEGNTYNMLMVAFKDEEGANKFYKKYKDITDPIPQNGCNSCDLNIKGINKGTGVNDVLNYFNIDPKDAYAFGDGLNDYEMLEKAFNGYRMKNGHIKLKEATDLEAPDVLDDGFYQIMVKEGLIKEKI